MSGIMFCKKAGTFAVVVIFLMIGYSCERTDYELLDPESAGKWTLYTTADGLPGNEVSDIQLDRRNNLWCSFPGYGTASYDYSTWTLYRTATTPLLNDNVNCLAEASDGGIIFGTADGLSVLSENNVWSSFYEPATTLYINTIKVASNGWIWVGTQDQGVYVNDGSGYTKVPIDSYKTVNTIEEGVQDNIFIGTDSGIIRWDGIAYSHITMADGLPDNKVTAMYFDREERLWVGTDAGKSVSWIDRSGIHDLNLMTGTANISVRDIWEDRKGDIWFATSGNGIIRYDGVIPNSFKEYNGFFENKVNCIGEDKDGNLWFGLFSKGLVKYTLPIDMK
jgi:ligand-binding sensor domain-containing protein